MMDSVSSSIVASNLGISASSSTLPRATTAAGLVLPLLPKKRIALSAEPSTFSASLKQRRRWASKKRNASAVIRATLSADDLDVLPVTSNDPVDQQQGGSVLVGLERSEDHSLIGSNPSGFSPDPPFAFDLSTAAASGGAGGGAANDAQVLVATSKVSSEEQQFVDRAINAMIVGAAGAFAITKILTVDHDYWHGWTVIEILRYAPLHNWSAYEDALKNNPILAKMMISGVVYSIGDWIAQCYEGKPILDFNRKRMIRSGLVGFCLHGSLSHFYYHVCEALFPFKDWWGVPIKVAFDQTIWSGFWNSIYFVTLGLLRFESPVSIGSELRATFWPMLSAGWKLWPFAHVITYGVIPVEQRLLWVDCVELVWVTILSMYSNEKAEARILEGVNDHTNSLEVSPGQPAQRDENLHQEQ